MSLNPPPHPTPPHPTPKHAPRTSNAPPQTQFLVENLRRISPHDGVVSFGSAVRNERSPRLAKYPNRMPGRRDLHRRGAVAMPLRSATGYRRWWVGGRVVAAGCVAVAGGGVGDLDPAPGPPTHRTVLGICVISGRSASCVLVLRSQYAIARLLTN